jgi:hypothetical protein
MGGGGGAGGAPACNDIENTATVAACSNPMSAPPAMGGVIPDGTYVLEAFQSLLCLTVRQTFAVATTGVNTYAAQAVTNLGTGLDARSNVAWASSGTQIITTPVCGSSDQETWQYSVIDTGTPVKLRLRNSTSEFLYARIGN